MTIAKWLNKPYPQIEELSIKLALSFLVGLICFIFLLVFKPFGIDKIDSVLYISGFGLNAMIALLINYFLLPFCFPTFYHRSRWSVKKELIFFSTILFIIGTLNFTYNSIIGKEIAIQHSYWYFLYITSMVGILPILLMTYITEIVARRRNEVEAKELNTIEKTNIDNDEKSISLEGESISGNELVIPLSNFLYASSNNNYSEVYYRIDNKVKKMLLRLSLKKLSDQVATHPEIVRCHKSYLVNKTNITKINGNARSLVLSISGISEEIPVSRSFNRTLLR